MAPNLVGKASSWQVEAFREIEAAFEDLED